MLLYYSPITNHRSLITNPGRGGRAVDCAGLENRKAERPRKFESHPLRIIDNQVLISTIPPRIMLPHNVATLTLSVLRAGAMIE
jgi:hypothetical protein